jgi:hypothetical protein
MTKLKLGFAAGVAALVAFGVAACGPQAEKPADTAAPAAVEAPAAPAAPAEAPKKP